MSNEKWWKSAAVYQIYPSSFCDSNSDGIGDLPGILSKLDYLKELGIDVVWLSPIYKSPQADMGYDIADYRDIDPRYGTLKDYDALVEGLHSRGMKLMMDLVVNHSSDEHEWFQESKSSKTNPKRDWYIWRPPRYDADGTRHPPNNWKAQFQGSAWDYDETTDEYYLHLFLAKQPDLNWENPDVRQAVWELMRFWVHRGCDGFRMDVINIISKVDGLPDAPISAPDEEFQDARALFANGPRVHIYLQEMNREVLSKHDLITVGETPYSIDPTALAKYVLPANKELDMIFQFELVGLDSAPNASFTPRPWTLPEFMQVVNRWQTLERDAGYWNAVYIENHDQGRSVSRWADDSDAWRALSAKMLAVLEVSLSGTQYVFQGQEIGIRNFPRSWGIEEYKDVASQNWYKEVLERRRAEQGRDDVDMSDILDGLQKKARDHGRIPMQWNASPHGGFTTGTPWMRVNDDFPTWNAEAQIADPDSVLSFWKSALRLRKDNKVLIYGDFTLLDPTNKQVFAYRRVYGEKRAVILLNFTSETVKFTVASVAAEASTRGHVFGNYPLVDGVVGAEIELRAYEGRVYLS
uniref:Glycoside hydrolase family 13 protein n=1 Tax=Mycena chlorophos TaxID=658473 RepID=A0ABQ0MAS7_MYCCL|nr:glycoside hydrolase family 13 protein [Mycena chlorophos]